MRVVQEKIYFMSGENRLAGEFSYPADGEVNKAILLASPHPNFAGNMNNNVMQSLATGLGEEAICLRFDYRGVGESRINLPEKTSVFAYWEEVENKQNYEPASEDIAAAARTLRETSAFSSISLVGYSFGALVGLRWGLEAAEIERLVGIALPWIRIDAGFLADCVKPCLLLNGNDDFVYEREKAKQLAAVTPGCVVQNLLSGYDHFFLGRENIVTEIVKKYIYGEETVKQAERVKYDV